MKKTIIALMALAGVASAASIGYDEMTDAQKTDVKHHWSDAQTITASNTPWANISDCGTSFTISFDISNIQGINAGESMICISGSHLAREWSDGSMQLTLDANNNVILNNNSGGNSYAKFFDGSQRGDTSTNPVSYTMGGKDLGLSAQDSLTSVTTITFVSDASAKTFSLYNNGELVATQENWNTDTGVIGLQLGTVYGGAKDRKISGSFEIDNFTLWNRALSADEVIGLVVPEPTTATLSLLALAGLAARRRRK